MVSCISAICCFLAAIFPVPIYTKPHQKQDSNAIKAYFEVVKDVNNGVRTFSDEGLDTLFNGDTINNKLSIWLLMQLGKPFSEPHYRSLQSAQFLQWLMKNSVADAKQMHIHKRNNYQDNKRKQERKAPIYHYRLPLQLNKRKRNYNGQDDKRRRPIPSNSQRLPVLHYRLPLQLNKRTNVMYAYGKHLQ